MAWVSIGEIVRYQVNYYAGGKATSGHKYRAHILLRGYRADDVEKDDKALGAALFHRRPETIPDTDQLEPNGLLYCHYRWEDFPRVLDLLRNEKPVYLSYLDDEKVALIHTSLMEPVGEGEEPLSALSKTLETPELSKKRRTPK